MKEKLISIIIPAYNAEKFIKKCILSILKQSLKNFELIIVNDGSTDNTLMICEKLSTFDPRIKIYSIKNSGVSNARNYGIEKSNGDYIGFVDADDTIDKKMFQLLYDNILKYDADISICGYSVVYQDGHIEKKNDTRLLIECNSQDALKMLLFDHYFGGGVWNKLFKKELFDRIKFNIKYQFNEDRLLLIESLVISNKIIYADYSYYNYIKNDVSVTNKRITNDTKMLQVIDVNKRIRELVEEKYEDLNNYLDYNELISLLNIYRTFTLKTLYREFYKQKKSIRDQIKRTSNSNLLNAIERIELFFIRNTPFVYYLIIKLFNNYIGKRIKKKFNNV